MAVRKGNLTEVRLTNVTSTPGLSGTELRVQYGPTTVVDSVSIAVRPGRVTALVGPNGSGKSTVLRSLARLIRPAGGQIHVGQSPAADLSARDFARRVSLLTQHRATPVGVTVADVVGFGRFPHQGRFRGHDEGGSAAIARAMAITGVTPMAHRCVDELSGGELQRVWLAGCLAQQTGVLLLDEPTNHLDLRYQAEVLDLITELAQDHGIAVGVVLHDLDHAATVADEVVLLSHGRVRASGSVHEVLTADLLSEVYGIRVLVSHDPQSGTLSTRAIGRRQHAPT